MFFTEQGELQKKLLHRVNRNNRIWESSEVMFLEQNFKLDSTDFNDFGTIN